MNNKAKALHRLHLAIVGFNKITELPTDEPIRISKQLFSEIGLSKRGLLELRQEIKEDN